MYVYNDLIFIMVIIIILEGTAYRAEPIKVCEVKEYLAEEKHSTFHFIQHDFCTGEVT